MSKVFEIKEVGLDLRNPKKKLHEVTFPETGVDWILIDLMASNDPLIYDVCLKAATKGCMGIIEIDLSMFHSEDPWEEAWRIYKKWEDSYWSVPFITTKILFKGLPKNENPDSYPKGRDLFNSCKVGLEIVDQEKWLEEIENWKTYYDGKVPEFIARSISPLHYNLDFEKWFELSQSEKIGLDWNGGIFSRDMMEEVFGKSYLLSFAALNSDLILLPVYSDILTETSEQVNFLKQLIGMDISEQEEKKFILKKSVDRLKKAPKKIIYESLKMDIGDKTWVIPSNDTSVLYPYSDTSYSFSAPRRESFPLSDEPTEEKIAIKNLILETLGIKPEELGSKVAWRLITLAVVDWIREKYSATDRWEMEFVEIGDQALGISLTQRTKKKWYEKYAPETIEEVKNYILIMDSPDKVNLIDLAEIIEKVTEED